MKCPNDHTTLVPDEYEQIIHVEKCPICEGMWLDAGELEKIQETRLNVYEDELKRIPDYIGNAIELAKAELEEERPCPKCQSTLVKREYGYSSQIMIDICPNCEGVWLDSGEIRELELFYERCRMETAKMRQGFLHSLLNFFRK